MRSGNELLGGISLFFLAQLSKMTEIPSINPIAFFILDHLITSTNGAYFMLHRKYFKYQGLALNYYVHAILIVKLRIL